jgi:hypothetical protein
MIAVDIRYFPIVEPMDATDTEEINTRNVFVLVAQFVS